MHELALAKSLAGVIAEAAHEHGATRVFSATIEVGELAAIDSDALSFGFTVVTAGSALATCKLECRHAPLVVACPECGHEGPTTLAALNCSACGTSPVRVVSGRQMRLVSIDIDEAEPEPEPEPGTKPGTKPG